MRLLVLCGIKWLCFERVRLDKLLYSSLEGKLDPFVIEHSQGIVWKQASFDGCFVQTLLDSLDALSWCSTKII